MKCVYCYYSAAFTGEQEKDEKTKFKQGDIGKLKKWTQQAIKLGVKEVVVSGGEPLTHPLVFEYLRFLDKMNITYILFTNGTLVKRNIGQIKSLKSLSEIRMSLDGLKAQENLRGKGTTKFVIEALRMLSAANVKVGINTILTKENVNELDSLYNLFKEPELSVDKWRIDVPLPGGRARDVYQSLMPEWTDIKNAYKNLILKYYEERPQFGIRILNVFDSIWLDTNFMASASVNRFSLDDHPCSYYFGSITMEFDGSVKWCPSLPLIFGNLNHDKLAFILDKKNTSIHKFLSLKISDIKECINCRYLSLCGGGCRAYSFLTANSLLAKDIVSCELMSFIDEVVLPLIPALKKACYESN